MGQIYVAKHSVLTRLEEENKQTTMLHGSFYTSLESTLMRMSDTQLLLQLHCQWKHSRYCTTGSSECTPLHILPHSGDMHMNCESGNNANMYV